MDADRLGHHLIERDGVLERTAAGIRRTRQKRELRRMAATDVRERNTRENGEIVAMILQHFEIGRRLVIAPRPSRHELTWHHAEIRDDAKHPARGGVQSQRRRGLLRPGERRKHRVEKRQRERHPRPAKKVAARQRSPGGNIGTVRGEGLGRGFHIGRGAAGVVLESRTLRGFESCRSVICSGIVHYGQVRSRSNGRRGRWRQSCSGFGRASPDR